MIADLPQGLLLILTSIGAIQSLFLSVLIIARKKLSNRQVLLVALLISLTVRVGKSGLWIFSDDLPLWLLNLGFAAQAAIGPFLLLYTLSFLKRDWRLPTYYWLHLIPAVIILFFSPFLTLQSFWYQGAYKLLCYHNLAYTAFTFAYYYQKVYKESHQFRFKHRVWLILIISSSFILSFAYFSNYVLQISPYIASPLLYSLASYVVSFYGLRYQEVWSNSAFLQETKRYKNSLLADNQQLDYFNQLQELLKREQFYLESDLNLSRLAKVMNLQTQALSQVINEQANQNFPEYINSFRIEYAKKQLSDPKQHFKTISSIAFESGFHSLSAFNAAFKKFTQLTPSKYRKMNG